MLKNRYFVGIILTSREDRMFYGVAPNEKLAKYEACAAALKGMEVNGCHELEDHITTENMRDQIKDMQSARELVPHELKTEDGEFLDVQTYAERLFEPGLVKFEEPILISTNPIDSIFKAVAKVETMSLMEIGSTAVEATRRLAWTVV